jgi:hypothetical protein
MAVNKQKLGHPIFILSVLILIINDWFLKVTFHNFLTGKLSDFAGLLSFPFFLSAIFPKWTKLIHLLTALLFNFWKSELSQLPIYSFNSFGLPINRTIDYSDNFALISVIVSYFLFRDNREYILKPILIRTVVVVSSFAFMATTLPPHELREFGAINKKYHFNFSKRELVSRLNMVQLKEINSINKLSGLVDFDSGKNVFHIHEQKDTLALLLDYKKIKDTDTISYKSSFSELLITGNENTSSMILVNVYRYVPMFKKKDYQDKAIKEFEKRVIKKIKNYR